MAEPGNLAATRGVATFDLNLCSLHVHAPIDAVTDALAELRGATGAERGVAGREVELAAQGLVTLQLRGHDWTVALAADELNDGALAIADAAALSARLGVDAILYQCSDTASFVGYELVREGEVVESFSAAGWGMDDEFEDAEDMVATMQEAMELDDEEMAEWMAENWQQPASEVFEQSQAGTRFTSSLRQVDPDSIEDAYEFVETFFRDADAFEPALHFPGLVGFLMWQPGQRAVLASGLADDLVRLDWLPLRDVPARDA